MRRKNQLREGKKYRSVGMLLLVILIAIGFIGLFADQWRKKVRRIQFTVEGTMITSEKEIMNAAAISDSVSLADLDLLVIAKRIEKHPYVKNCDLTRNPPDGLEIRVQERTPIALIINEKEKEYFVDDDGVILPHVSSPYIYDLPIITCLPVNLRLADGERVLYTKLQQAIEVLTVAKQINEQLYHQFSEINLRMQQDLILYTMEHGIPVIFGPSVGTERKLRYFDAFWKNIAVNTGASQLEYIDLRFRERVIAKWSDQFMKPSPAVRDSIIEEL